ncbi:hypothetical protein TorRG33x02_144660 [Trema orientale]|uniref:Uncharacterized protein n=1 Tax=Trema orientale TaxID=63057 RepID=A0A2P5EW67_TREOI|nr:hypothetical protein TorRG33x02_144660 [Trema orientale]
MKEQRVGATALESEAAALRGVASGHLDTALESEAAALIGVASGHLDSRAMAPTRCLFLLASAFRGNEVGRTPVTELGVRGYHHRRFNITVYADSDKVSSSNDIRDHLASDLGSENLSFFAYANFNSIQMNCSFVVNVETEGISSLSCY